VLITSAPTFRSQQRIPQTLVEVNPHTQNIGRRSVNDMSTGHHHDCGRYEIRLKGHLDSRWVAWFDGMSLTNESDGITVIRGPVIDQAALHGLLQKLRDLNLPLVSVTQVDLTAAPTDPRQLIEPQKETEMTITAPDPQRGHESR
jgi:hypothetical protein